MNTLSKKLAFISRHSSTEQQQQLANQLGFILVDVGDRNAFTFDVCEFDDFDGVVVVHPWMALKASENNRIVGVFENANRAPEGEKPSFEARALHLHNFKGHDYVEVAICSNCKAPLSDLKQDNCWECGH